MSKKIIDTADFEEAKAILSDTIFDKKISEAVIATLEGIQEEAPDIPQARSWESLAEKVTSADMLIMILKKHYPNGVIISNQQQT